MSKKIQAVFSLIEVAENNLKTAKQILAQMLEESEGKISLTSGNNGNAKISRDEEEAKEVVEGYFDGEHMIGNNGQTYLVPQNYASKTQLVIGDKMKWILTPTREIFKLIQPVEREKVEGVFLIEGDNYLVKVENIETPVRILKASATFAMKTQNLKPGDVVSILIPRDATPRWGAFLTVVRSSDTRPDINDLAKQAGAEKNKFDELEIFKNVMDPEDLVKKEYLDEEGYL